MNLSTAKKTALYDWHLSNSGKLVEFAGYALPIQFEGIKPEHQQVREKVGLFDVSHMGTFLLDGKETIEFLNYVTYNNVSKLSIGQAQYNAFGNDHAGLMDDLILYRLEENRFQLIVNGSNRSKNWTWLNQHANGFNISLKDNSEETSIFALQGPLALEMLQCWEAFKEIKPFHFAHFIYEGQKLGVGRTGYTGEDGFEFYVPKSLAFSFWKFLMKLGEKQGIKPIGLGARDTLRMEAGLPLYGQDLSEEKNVLESGLKWIIDFDKKDFIGKAKIKKPIGKKSSNRKSYWFKND